MEPLLHLDYHMKLLGPNKDGHVRATTIRLTPGDEANIQKLMELSGHESMAAAIRYAIRRTLWELESMSRGSKPKV